MKNLLGVQLCHLFKYAELTEVIIRNYKLFMDLPDKLGDGNIVDNVDNLLMTRFIRESDEHYPKNALQMYAQNEQSIKTNEVVLNPLSANPTKWSNTLKQFVGNLPTNCLSV